MERPTAPCRHDCADRCAVPNCHSTCIRYLKYKEAWANYTAEVSANKMREYDITCFKKDQVAKVKKEVKK